MHLLSLFLLLNPIISEPHINVRQASIMDKNIATIKDFRQYLQSVQKIYLKQTFLLPIDKYVTPKLNGIGLRGAFGTSDEDIATENPANLRPEMAMPAACMPEMTSVPIYLDNITATSIVFPTCTRIEQCGGCCSHPLLSCQPSKTEYVERDVLVIDVETQTDRRLTTQLTRHLECGCACRVQEHHCNSRQVYHPDQCKCECSNWAERILCTGRSKLWDENLCTCRCTNIEMKCSTGMSFSRESCRCELNQIEESKPPLHGRPNSRNRV